MSSSSLEDRVAKIEKRVERIEKRLRKKVKERKLSLRECFQIHDRMRRLVDEFEAIVGGLPEDVWFSSLKGQTFNQRPARIKDLKEIVKQLAKLIDYALGVTFP